MASLGHIAVGMAAARIDGARGRAPWRSMAAWSALSMLPDADVIGFGLGIAYGDPWGHRGATHSFAFSLAVGAAVGLAASWFGRSALRTGLTAALVLASHALLDTLTNGGLGCALLWPFDLTRYFAPWNPIPVSPIGLGYLSAYGLMVSLVEIVLFGPLFAFALWPARGSAPRRRAAAAAGVAAWAIAGWFVTSRDPVREAIVGFSLGEQTEYAPGYSERALRRVEPGQPEGVVREALGAPLAEDWAYRLDQTQPCSWIEVAEGRVVSARDAEACLELGIDSGTARASVSETLGQPPEACWHYTRGAANRYFRLRSVCFERGKVMGVFREWRRR